MRDETLLQEIRERRIYATDEWSDIRKEAQKDMRCVAGNPWDPDDEKARDDAKRPVLKLDELGQYFNQVINDVRANPRGMKFSPTGNGANDKGAEFYQNKAREIEYRSSAQIAYTTAFENAVQRSYGWVRIRAKFDPGSMHQDLWIEPVMNPDNVLADPDSIWPDSRDISYLFYLESRLTKEFKREFPGATIKDFGPEFEKIAPQWISERGERVTVAEYWTKDTYQRKLLVYQPVPSAQDPQPAPVTVYLDQLPDKQLPEGVVNFRERMADDAKVMQYLTNGVEILKTTPHPGKYIPFISCFGKVLYVDEGQGTKRQILSMTRLARSPYMLYCYIRSLQSEMTGMVTKFPYFFYEGQLSNKSLTDIAKSLHEPVAGIAVKPTIEGLPPGEILPFPQRNLLAPDLSAYELFAEAARRAIQAAMGISPLPTQAQRQNEKSGKALRQIESSGQKGSFHFVDHYDGMIQQAGIVLEDLMDKVLDTARDVGVRKADESAVKVRINDPRDPDAVDTKGDYLVTVSTGPATESQRVEAAEFVDTLMSNIEMVAQIAGPDVAKKVMAKSIKLRLDGPIVDQIADAISPPEQTGPDGQPLQQPPTPREQQMHQQLQQVTQELQKAGQMLQSKQVEQDGKFKIEAMTQQATTDRELRLKRMDIAAKIEAARITAGKASLDQQAAAFEERIALAFDSAEQAKDRTHDVNLALLDHAHQTAQNDQQHDQALEQGQQGIGGQLAVQDNAPQPQAGAGA